MSALHLIVSLPESMTRDQRNAAKDGFGAAMRLATGLDVEVAIDNLPIRWRGVGANRGDYSRGTISVREVAGVVS